MTKTAAHRPKTPPSRIKQGAQISRGGVSPRKKSQSQGQTRASVRRHALPRWNLASISPERKLDILGVFLVFLGLLSLLSLLSTQRSFLTGWWVTTLYQMAGWGAFILPLALIAVGVWTVFRNLDRLPLISMERMVGIVLLFFNLLTWMHLSVGGGWEIILSNRGGGYLGAIFERILVSGIGKAGSVVALAAWGLIGLAFMLDLSIQDLLHLLPPVIQSLRRPASPIPVAEPNPLPPIQKNSLNDPNHENVLPGGFHPLGQQLQPQTIKIKPAGSSAISVVESKPDRQTNPEAVQTQTISPVPQSPAWKLPAVNQILDLSLPAVMHASQDQDRARVIETTLASFSVPAHVVEIHHGPTITQFGVEPDFTETRTGRMRVRVSKIVALQNDLALALAAPRIRIQAPVPGRNYVGIEVPNSEISRVTLRDVIESDIFQKNRSPLRFGLGKDVAGKVIPVDLAALPHLLIAGTTGAGKSVCVNGILCCLLLNNTPDDLRLVLVDPKRVELTGYNGIPHLLAPVVVEPERVVAALQWMLREMDNRYRRFSQLGVRNIQEFNTRKPEERLPYLVVVVDELADLMMQAPDETERVITRLAQLARATGIHLILATQRPSVNVVTGLIKANFPARIAFMVAAMIDSRVILDQPGAERLLGRGDMLYQAPDSPAPVRVQGAFVADGETQRLVEYWRNQTLERGQGVSVPVGGAVDALPSNVPLKQTPLWDDKELGSLEGDPLLADAIELVRREGRASITMLQRRMRIGYTRSARLIDAMEEQRIIAAPVANSQVREILDYGPMAPPKEE